jgi:hypothetical protein
VRDGLRDLDRAPPRFPGPNFAEVAAVRALGCPNFDEVGGVGASGWPDFDEVGDTAPAFPANFDEVGEATAEGSRPIYAA